MAGGRARYFCVIWQRPASGKGTSGPGGAMGIALDTPPSSTAGAGTGGPRVRQERAAAGKRKARFPAAFYQWLHVRDASTGARSAPHFTLSVASIQSTEAW